MCNVEHASFSNHQSCIVLLASTLFSILAIDGNTAAANSEIKRLRITTEEITFKDRQNTLAGTLYLPSTGEMRPAVVLVKGSDRSARGPLLTNLGMYFAEHGIAALQYDSPGTGKSTGNTLLQSCEDRATEAVNAIRYLGTRGDIDHRRTGLWGGSEGASVVLLAAAMYAKEVPFVISVSGSSMMGGGSILERTYHSAERFAVQKKLTLEQMFKIITIEQLTYVFLTGINFLEWDLIEQRTKNWGEEPWGDYINICKMRTNDTMLTTAQKQEMLTLFRRTMKVFMEVEWSKLHAFQKRQLQQIMNMDVNQFYTFLQIPRITEIWDWDLRHRQEKVRCPVLAVFGENDSWVPANLMATRLAQYLSTSGNRDFQVKVFPGANHILTKTGSKGCDDFVPGYLELMTSWIHAHTPGKS